MGLSRHSAGRQVWRSSGRACLFALLIASLLCGAALLATRLSARPRPSGDALTDALLRSQWRLMGGKDALKPLTPELFEAAPADLYQGDPRYWQLRIRAAGLQIWRVAQQSRSAGQETDREAQRLERTCALIAEAREAGALDSTLLLLEWAQCADSSDAAGQAARLDEALRLDRNNGFALLCRGLVRLQAGDMPGSRMDLVGAGLAKELRSPQLFPYYELEAAVDLQLPLGNPAVCGALGSSTAVDLNSLNALNRSLHQALDDAPTGLPPNYIEYIKSAYCGLYARHSGDVMLQSRAPEGLGVIGAHLSTRRADYGEIPAVCGEQLLALADKLSELQTTIGYAQLESIVPSERPPEMLGWLYGVDPLALKRGEDDFKRQAENRSLCRNWFVPLWNGIAGRSLREQSTLDWLAKQNHELAALLAQTQHLRDKYKAK